MARTGVGLKLGNGAAAGPTKRCCLRPVISLLNPRQPAGWPFFRLLGPLGAFENASSQSSTTATFINKRFFRRIRDKTV